MTNRKMTRVIVMVILLMALGCLLAFLAGAIWGTAVIEAAGPMPTNTPTTVPTPTTDPVVIIGTGETRLITCAGINDYLNYSPQSDRSALMWCVDQGDVVPQALLLFAPNGARVHPPHQAPSSTPYP